MSKRIHVDGLNLELVRSKRKTLGLELSSSGLKARAPMRMPEKAIIDFIRVKRTWIDKHLDSMPPAPASEKIELIDGATLFLRGQSFSLKIELGRRSSVRVIDKQIIVPVIHGSTPLQQRVKNKLVKWYKNIAQQELQTRARYYAAMMNVPERRTDQIYVRDYKRRWGSCDSNGKLSFNWRILQAPTEVSDYVIVHELAHCHEFNHSKRFWAIVAAQLPDYASNERWLHHHGYSLYRF